MIVVVGLSRLVGCSNAHLGLQHMNNISSQGWLVPIIVSNGSTIHIDTADVHGRHARGWGAAARGEGL
jgi:hypothetical protein